jgi:hypothetical protein
MAAIKLPTRDIVNIETQVLSDLSEIEKYIFQDIAGTQLINLVRHDTISGVDVVYSVISDLTKVNIDFDPSLLLINKAQYQSIFNQYSIKLVNKIPEETYYDENQELPENNLLTNAYYDGENLILEFNNVKTTELVQVEVETDGKINRVRENDYF